jgi:hypothetical protein
MIQFTPNKKKLKIDFCFIYLSAFGLSKALPNNSDKAKLVF